jgi:tetratricopeptide (TPR) repeat protein
MKIWNKIKSMILDFSLLRAEHKLKIYLGLHSTFLMALIAGVVGIIGYSVNLENFKCKMLYVLFLLALASFISGFFLGFLFGIPKRSDDREDKYQPSSHLSEISDWLTKIIIGLGLVEIKAIPGALYSVGMFIQKSTGAETSIVVFSISCILYFSIFGLYFGYNYTRLFLSQQYVGADKNLMVDKELSAKAKTIDPKKLVPENMDESTKRKLADYNQFLTTKKKEPDYTFDDWFYKGLNAYQSHQYNNAITFLERALSLDDNSEKAADANFNIGSSYYKLKLYDIAYKIFTKMLNNFPEYDKKFMVYNNIGVVLLKLKKGIDAIEVLDKSLTIKPNYASAFYNKACSYSLLKQKAPMLENLQKAIEIDPEFKVKALADPDFANYADDPEYKKLF